MNSVWAVRRADVFSPNSVEADRNILLSVLERLGADSSRLVDERDLTAAHTAEIYLSMARRPQTLAILREKERQGAVVVNATAGVLACSRSELERLMRREHLPTAPIEGPNGYWVKRGDAAAQSKDDVVFPTQRDSRCCGDGPCAGRCGEVLRRGGWLFPLLLSCRRWTFEVRRRMQKWFCTPLSLRHRGLTDGGHYAVTTPADRGFRRRCHRRGDGTFLDDRL